MTTIQELIKFLKNDRMQNVYTGEQIIELLEFKLEKEKQQIEDAWDSAYTGEGFFNAEQYYKEQYIKKCDTN